MSQTRLYSYCIPIDDGAAPNPYWGYCTLAICKPAIRRTARIGDWIVGTGSRNSRGRDLSGKVVYAMRVSDVKSFMEYDEWVRKACPNKRPDMNHWDTRRKVGDAIYYFSGSRMVQRKGVHDKTNEKRDLSGKNVLISDHFYYFGTKPIQLPKRLQPIVHQHPGHKVDVNAPYVDSFLRWLKGLKKTPNHLYGLPAHPPSKCGPSCASRLRGRPTESVGERFARNC